MSRERLGIELPDITSFKPRADRPAPVNDEIKQVAEKAGFRTRHAAEQKPAPVVNSFDARALRRTGRTAKLNIATTPEARERFWRLAQDHGLVSGEEVLVAMMDAFEKHQ